MTETPFFLVKTGGRVRKYLAVYLEGDKYRLNYLVLGRSNPTKAERNEGAKEKRHVIFEETVVTEKNDIINAADFPIPELTAQFIDFLAGSNNNGH